MTRFLFGILALCVLIGCQGDKKTDRLLSDSEFEKALLDVEFARSSSRTLPYHLQDSVFQIYMDAVASRYDLSKEELQYEIEWRLKSEEQFIRHYEAVSSKLDSLSLIDTEAKEDN